MTVSIRPMTADDVPAAVEVQVAAFAEHDRRMGDPVEPVTDEVRRRSLRRHGHLVAHDPDGCWVATEGQQVVGCALALRRDRLWGLSLLVVDPGRQSGGAGRRLLDASLRYAAGCDRRVILSSRDPRAMRLYATSGLDLHPQVRAVGPVDPRDLPPESHRVREGSEEDLAMADRVVRLARGAALGPDHQMLQAVARLYVVDDEAGEGFAYLRPDGVVSLLAACDDATATELLRHCLARTVELGRPASVDHITAGQQWAIRAAYQARLTVEPAGPAFWSGSAPPAAYLPSGAYF